MPYTNQEQKERRKARKSKYHQVEHVALFRLKTVRTLVFFFVIASVLTGCASYHPLPSKLPLSVDDLYARVIRNRSTGTILEGIARVRVTSPNSAYTRKIAVVLRSPSSLRMDAVPLFGTPDFFLAMTNKSFKVYLPREGKFYIGRPTERNLRDFFTIPLPALDAVALMTGTPPGKPRGATMMDASRDGSEYRLDIFEGKTLRQSLWMDPTSYHLTKIATRTTDGILLYEARFGSYRQEGSVLYPQSVTVSLQAPPHTVIRISYLSLEEREETTGEIFTLYPPKGVRPVFID